MVRRERQSTPSAKLNPEQVRAIRRDPRKLKNIASDYQMHLQSIWAVKAKKTWSHIT
jgi:hypothetical protein